MTSNRTYAKESKSGSVVLLVTLLWGSAMLVACSADTDVDRDAASAPEQRAKPPAPMTPTAETSYEQLPEWIEVHSYDFDWDGDGNLDHFLLENNKNDWDARLTVTLEEGSPHVFEFEGIWEFHKYGLDSLKHELTNLSDSPYLFFVRKDEPVRGPPYLLLSGNAYASDPGRFHILSMEDRTPKILFGHQTFWVRGFDDLDGDVIRELHGYPCASQVWGYGYSLYVPTQVYKFPGGTGAAKLSIPLSREFTSSRLNGWAGTDCTGDPIVVQKLPDGSGPKIMSEEEADKLFEEAKRKQQ